MFVRCFTLIAILFSAGIAGCQTKPGNGADARSGFAVVELFTSEGCSSCPAAERTLASLQQEFPSSFYVLEFHVDYWNYLGWRDEFSDSAYSLRQQDYARHFGLQSCYTPQAVVNGQRELVGSDKQGLEAAVNRGLAQPPVATLSIEAQQDASGIKISYKTVPGAGLLHIAIVQKTAITQVRAGENSGRRLTHMNVVRSFATAGPGSAHGTLHLPLPAGAQPGDYEVIAFTQNDKAVTSATSAAIAPL